MKNNEAKEYRVETWNDLLNLVTEENLEYLMVDMYKMLDQWVQIKKSLTEDELKNIKSEGFTWIDDGHNDIYYKLNGTIINPPAGDSL